jgi:peptidoglycan/LPS O-acetylase OafA/YrhL
VQPIAHKHWRALSEGLTALHVAVAVVHVFPRLVYGSKPTTGTVVVYVSTLGPVWVILFGATALGMAVTLHRRRGRHWAHLAAAALWVLYTSALGIGAWATKGPILFPIVAASVVFVHTKLAAGYEYEASKEARR